MHRFILFLSLRMLISTFPIPLLMFSVLYSRLFLFPSFYKKGISPFLVLELFTIMNKTVPQIIFNPSLLCKCTMHRFILFLSLRMLISTFHSAHVDVFEYFTICFCIYLSFIEKGISLVLELFRTMNKTVPKIIFNPSLLCKCTMHPFIFFYL
jgi:hypothetical protein